MTVKLLKTVALVGMLSSTPAFAVTITPGNPGNQGTDNVLFNDNSLSHSGALVQGNFNGSGSGFIIDFTSGGDIQGSGGQATITGLGNNNPFTTLTFQLEGGATFTKAILNPDATDDGTIEFTVNYIDGAGSPLIASFSVDGNGQNFFGIEAQGTEKIVSVSFEGIETTFENASQFRIGGFASGQEVRTPDGGSTFALGGLAMLALGSLRAKLRR